jgi:hypothetical protein
MRIIAAAMVGLTVIVVVLAFARPILAKSAWIEVGMAQIVDLMAQGCGPGWHWSNRRGWNWGRCVRDRRPGLNRW